MKCLLVIDVQNDFLPGGALAVPNGDAILPVVNRLIQRFLLVVATQDWHPAGHSSFASSHEGRQPLDQIELGGRPQTLWPDHCIQGTTGAEFASQLETRPIAAIFRKGMDPKVDSYSAFFDNHRLHQTGLTGYLDRLGVDEIFLSGLAAEICVAFTAGDAADEGFRPTVIEDATQPLDPVAFKETKKQLEEKGVRFARSSAILTDLEARA